jgi:2-C-methyl-D-erythritol 2,4-cyclodiphosphate synthase
MAQEFRVGHGFDIHRFRRGRKLILGGVEIPSKTGLIGHSDADVVLHALMNAILGAIGADDIGMHFPDSDGRYRGVASTELLRQVLTLMRQKKFKLVNVDFTLIAEQPKLAPYYAAMRASIAQHLNVPKENINLKATTTERLGWIGEGKGMAAMAVALLRR